MLIHAAEIGDPAPAFSTLDQNEQTWSLAEHTGKNYLIIYFYPGAMTGGCTKQACSYRDYLNSGGDLNVEVIGISGDSPQSLHYFQQAEQLNFTLLSDPDGSIAKQFGVPARSIDKTIKRTVEGNEVELTRKTGIARWTFILDPDGKIIYRKSNVRATEDMSNAMNFIRGLKN
jgi:peroxiredoxin Q/BCP